MATTSLADAKNRLSEIVSAAETTHERTVVTKNGRPAAVIMSVADLESLLETLSILRDPDLTTSLLEPLEPRETVSPADVLTDLHDRGREQS